jgi:hypothetical protein
MPPRRRTGRKLLIASIGVAAIAYGCSKDPKQPEPVGNLVAPPPPPDAGAETQPAQTLPVQTVTPPAATPDAGAGPKTKASGGMGPHQLGF